APGHLRRSLLRWERELRRLGSSGLSRRADDGESGGAEGGGKRGAEGESQVGVRLRRVHEGRQIEGKWRSPSGLRGERRAKALRHILRLKWRSSSKIPMSWSWAWARPAASPRCRWRRPASK